MTNEQEIRAKAMELAISFFSICRDVEPKMQDIGLYVTPISEEIAGYITGTA